MKVKGFNSREFVNWWNERAKVSYKWAVWERGYNSFKNWLEKAKDEFRENGQFEMGSIYAKNNRPELFFGR